jgi:molybdate transport system substrate-binding protein
MILAAATLKPALDTVVKAAETALHVQIVTVYGPSPTLVKQLENGSPGDIFFSADQDWMNDAIAHNVVDPSTRVDLLSSKLVLVAPAAQAQQVTVAPGFPLARLLGSGRLAMCDPMMMPAGRYGRAALEKLGVWNDIKDRVAIAEDVLAALVLVSRQEAALGIVFDTDARLDPNVAVIGTFPPESYPPIVYPVAAVAGAGNPDTGLVLEFLKSPTARLLFEAQGYVVTGPSR